MFAKLDQIYYRTAWAKARTQKWKFLKSCDLSFRRKCGTTTLQKTWRTNLSSHSCICVRKKCPKIITKAIIRTAWAKARSQKCKLLKSYHLSFWAEMWHDHHVKTWRTNLSNQSCICVRKKCPKIPLNFRGHQKRENLTSAAKLYIPSTLNNDYLLWHTQLIVCAVKY